MVVLIVLVGSLLLFRGLGALGIPLFEGWNEATRFALATMFLFTSSAHFTKIRHDLARMMPRIFPNPIVLVYFTGFCEILGAIGILVPQTSKLPGNAWPSLADLPPSSGCAFPCNFSLLC